MRDRASVCFSGSDSTSAICVTGCWSIWVGGMGFSLTTSTIKPANRGSPGSRPTGVRHWANPRLRMRQRRRVEHSRPSLSLQERCDTAESIRGVPTEAGLARHCVGDCRSPAGFSGPPPFEWRFKVSERGAGGLACLRRAYEADAGRAARCAASRPRQVPGFPMR